ncbi:hypothetical protein A244_36205, partial [Pseudomonas syringae pv. actinidiae ICMP 18807]
CIGIGRREDARIDQYQTREPHVFHGASGPADISGMGSADQDNTDVLQQGKCSLMRIRGANLTETTRLTL